MLNWRAWLKRLDVFLFLLSPLAILCVVVAVIVLADRYATHRGDVLAFEREGAPVSAAVFRIEPEDGLVIVAYPEGGETRYGLMYTHYYPQALTVLNEGQRLTVRALPAGQGDRVVWEERFGQFAGYWGYATAPLGMLVCAWAVVILHPEFLYLGYADFNPGKL